MLMSFFTVFREISSRSEIDLVPLPAAKHRRTCLVLDIFGFLLGMVFGHMRQSDNEREPNRTVNLSFSPANTKGLVLFSPF